MNVFMSASLSYALNALWQVPLITFAGWLVNRVCRQAHPRMLHRAWVATLLLAVFLPAVGMRSGWSVASTGKDAAAVRLLAPGTDVSPQSHLFEHGVLTLSRTWIDILAGFYLLLVSVAILRLVFGLVKTLRLSRLFEPVTLTPEQLQIWQRCRTVFCIEAAALRTSDAIIGPAVVGWHRPVLLLPMRFLDETTDEELLAALAHECAHIARRD